MLHVAWSQERRCSCFWSQAITEWDCRFSRQQSVTYEGSCTRWWSHLRTECSIWSLCPVLQAFFVVLYSDMCHWHICSSSILTHLKARRHWKARRRATSEIQSSIMGQSWRTSVCYILASCSIEWPISCSCIIIKTMPGGWCTACGVQNYNCGFDGCWLFWALDECGSGLLWLPRTGRSFFLSGSHIEAPIGHKDFEHEANKSPGFFCSYQLVGEWLIVLLSRVTPICAVLRRYKWNTDKALRM